MRRTRPTLRCLTEDLKLPVPLMNEPLDEIDHPILAKAVEQFGSRDDGHERIVSIDDRILFKVKVRRWRGAVWIEPDLPWLVAAGRRESGSADDFYQVLAVEGRAARARYNAVRKPPLKSDTCTAHLLPGRDDQLRHRVEAGVRFVRLLETLIADLVRNSLRDGCEHTVDFDAFGLGVQVRAEHGHETYVAIRIVGPVPEDLTKVILDVVPGCDSASWYPEAALPGRLLGPNEEAWSTIMDPVATAALLDAEDR